MASPGVGSAGHLSGELFKMMTGVQMTHVPYRSGGPALTDLIGGQVQVLFAGALESIEYVRTGKIAHQARPASESISANIPGASMIG
jgi:tripartite-type tricarboxylate transporter receptor subunit TctC